MRYQLHVHIDPSRHWLHVDGQIFEINADRLYLNRDFTVLKMESKGKPLHWRWEENQEGLPFQSTARALIWPSEIEEIEIEYEGYIRESISGVNQISEEEVELSLYSTWYPRDGQLNKKIEFNIELKLPNGYTVVSNGCQEGMTIRSEGVEEDIVVYASKQICPFVYQKQELSMTFYCPEQYEDKVERLAQDLNEAYRLFTDWYGKLSNQVGRKLVGVYRPKGGWGYRRGWLTMSTAAFLEDQAEGDFHELAHSWWSIAAVEQYDWINEGGAEYSAYAAAREIYGEKNCQRYIEDYWKWIHRCKEKISIAATTPSSADRYANLYCKTTVMWLEAEKSFGREAVISLLRKVYQTCKEGRAARTETVLALCDPELQGFLREKLNQTEWSSQG